MKKYDNYKDSGVEWLGLIPINWKVTKLKFIGSAIGGLTYSPNDVVEDENSGTLVLRSSNIQNGKLSLHDNVYVNLEISEKLTLKKGDILICSRNGSQHLIGKNICIDERTEGSTFGAFMMIFRSNYYGYLNHFFNSPIFTSQSGLFLTATINQLTSSTLNNFYLALPSSIEEQTIIANYLDHKTTQIDHLIAKKEQFIHLLEEERIAVINQAVTKGLDPNVSMKDSGIEWLGEIPEHWEVKKLKLLANIQGRIGFKGYTVGDLVSEGEGALTLGAKHIDKFNQLNLSNPEFISWDKYYESPEIMVQIGDIILTQRGTLGKVVLITEDIGKATINPSMVILSKLKANDYFLYYFFNSDYFKSWIDLTNTATAVPMISQGQLGNLKLVLPNNDEQNQIVNSIQKSTKKIDDIIVKAQQEIELLKEYKTALISEVVTGKVDVRNEKLN
jgi:type I restriction enzyme S subunit